MKKHFQGFMCGVLVTVMVLGLSVSAFAITGRMTLEVDSVNIQVNGEVFRPTDVNGTEVPVFAYNGTTYAPLRALAEAYGLEVGYDANANMATVNRIEEIAISEYSNGMQTYTAITGRQLKSELPDEEATLYVYDFFEDEGLKYTNYLLDNGWSLYKKEREGLKLKCWYYKGSALIGMIADFDENEMYITVSAN